MERPRDTRWEREQSLQLSWISHAHSGLQTLDQTNPEADHPQSVPLPLPAHYIHPITTHQLYLGPQAFQNPVSCLSFLLQEESRVRAEGNRGEEEGEQG